MERELLSFEDGHYKKNQHWFFAGLVTVGHILGTGVLALPFALKSLGFYLGAFVCVIFGLYGGYMGLILGRVRNRFYPECTSYYAVAERVSGPALSNAFKVITAATWFFVSALYLLVAVNALRAAYPNDTMCGYSWSGIFAAVLLPAFLLRTMKSIEWLVLLSDLSIVIVVMGILIQLGRDGRDPSTKTNKHPPHEDFWDAYNPISSFVFAYQGQAIFLEIMGEMKQPRDWPWALWTGQCLMAPLYTITAITAYYYLGEATPAYLPAALKDGPLKKGLNLLVAYHVLVGYVINNVALLRLIKTEWMSGGKTSRMAHWTVCFVICAVAWLIANLIPFFGDLVSIIGAITGGPILFGGPALFYALAMKQKGYSLSRFDAFMCVLSLVILLPFTTVVGTTAAIRHLKKTWSENGPVFACHSY